MDSISTNPNIIKGIDVSQWQGFINFPKVKEEGIEMVYIKATEGIDFVDPFFETNYKNAAAAGLQIGFYHYLTARSVSQARQEAYHFVDTVKGKISHGKLAMDFEDLKGLSREEINDISLAFLKAVENYSNKEAAIYSDAYNAAHTFEPDLTAFSLWIAEYDVSAPSTDNPWGTWDGWQYTDKLRINGITGNVDGDYFHQGIFNTSSEPTAVTGTKTPPRTTMILYRVNAGDTLSGIARKYRTTVSAIAAANHITNPNFIYVGEMLRVPIDDTRGVEDNFILYTVEKGNTLYSIAQAHRTTVAAIERINRLPDPALIFPGQIIKLPR